MCNHWLAMSTSVRRVFCATAGCSSSVLTLRKAAPTGASTTGPRSTAAAPAARRTVMAQRRVPLGSAITAPLTSVARPTGTGVAAASAQSPDPGSSFTITVVSLVFDRTSTAAYTAWPVSDGMRSRASFATTAALSGAAGSAVHPHHFSPSNPSVGSSLGMGEPSTGLHWLGSAAAKFRWTTPALEKVWKPMPTAALLLAAATVRGRIRTSASCRIPFAPTLDANCPKLNLNPPNSIYKSSKIV